MIVQSLKPNSDSGHESFLILDKGGSHDGQLVNLLDSVQSLVERLEALIATLHQLRRVPLDGRADHARRAAGDTA